MPSCTDVDVDVISGSPTDSHPGLRSVPCLLVLVTLELLPVVYKHLTCAKVPYKTTSIQIVIHTAYRMWLRSR